MQVTGWMRCEGGGNDKIIDYCAESSEEMQREKREFITGTQPLLYI
jgi:hypothetical protein